MSSVQITALVCAVLIGHALFVVFLARSSGCTNLLTLAWIGLKALFPQTLCSAYTGIAREALGRIPLDQDGQRQLLIDRYCEEFDATTLKERHTFGGGFQAVGVVPWFIAAGLVPILLTLPIKGHGALVDSDAWILLWLLWFPAIYRAGRSLVGGGSGMLFVGNLGWVGFGLFIEAVLGFVVYVAIGLIRAPLHAALLAWKWSKWLRELREGTADWD